MKKEVNWQVIIIMCIAVVAIISGSGLFLSGLVSQFEEQPFSLDSEYYNNSKEETIDTETLNAMLSEEKSFILISYLPTCTNDIISFTKTYSEKYQISYFYTNWTGLRDSTLKDVVKFSPSVVIIKSGKPIDFLDANSNNYIPQYSSYDNFESWLNRYIVY